MQLPGLNIPQAELKFRIFEENRQVWDNFRKKWVNITPEEWVRQQVLHFMVNEKQFPTAMIALETGIKFAGRKKRTDAKLFLPGGEVLMLMEFKAPNIKINNSTILQASVYAGVIKPKFIFLSNGLQHYWLSLESTGKNLQWNEGIPIFNDLI
jgi:hypothetical protein